MISFEILEAFQNHLRPLKHEGSLSSFQLVAQAIDLISKYYSSVVVRSTITPFNVNKLPEMVKFIADRFPKVRKIQVELVADNTTSHRELYNDFLEYFFKARIIGNKSNVSLVSMLYTSFFGLKDGVCRGEYCLTPSGNIIGCHRHSKTKDIQHPDFTFGSITDNKLIINDEKKRTIGNYGVHPFNLCNSCFAQYHCSGGCRSMARSYNDKQKREYCEFVKAFYKRLILTKLNSI